MEPSDGYKNTDFNKKNGSAALAKERTRWVEHFRPNPIRLPESATLFDVGQDAIGFYCLLKGAVKLQMRNQRNEPFTYFIARPYELLGFYDMFNRDSTHTISVKTLKPVEVGFMDKSYYIRLLNDKPFLTYTVLNQLHLQIKRMEQKMKMFRQGSSQLRVIALLQELVKDFGIDHHHWLNLALYTEDIADLAGISKTYMKKLLPGFRSENLFETRKNHIRIIDPEKLQFINTNQEDSN